ncbi:LPXTG cell wall anchor domain-containing protein [Enterococcus sp. 5H]|uniref:LPXTG cell wall anchor domain-containing protein n=1 Tax=Enterococcus sp. 5H TaxID=1229490 RepID=UPI002303F42B|nr:LPXTG cell wall anchor domain-containing protein [Enterococcus sp. 5H]MDA9472810.1 hypothetical protein [Enterococcus sp. 5H]
MKLNKVTILFYSLIVLISVSISPTFAYGIEGTGGQVTTGGGILFYEEESVPDDSTPAEPSEPEKPETDTAAKPAGRLPSTGEWIGNVGFIGIGLLLLFLLLLLVRKWAKEEK